MPKTTIAPAPWDTPGTSPTDAAEAAKQAEIAAQAAASTNPPGTDAATPAAPDTASGGAVETASEVTVTVTVPKAFNLRMGHTADDLFHYKAGVQEMLLAHAEHWYSKAHGVTIYKRN